MARGYRPNSTAQRIPPTHRNNSCLKRMLWRVAMLYIVMVSLFTCPGSPEHPVCRAKALVQTSLVEPVHSLVLSTETGARVDAAYRAHLVPFYEKHGAPIVSGAQTLVCDAVAPAVKLAVRPVSDAVWRVAGPHVAKVSALYSVHAKPTVDAVGGAVCGAISRVVIPVTSTVVARTAYGMRQYVVPFGRSAVNDYAVPFYANHVHPRWNHQIKPALCRYSRVAIEYTRSSVLPAIADGACYGYGASRDFAATYIVPHSKRVAVHVYAFFKRSVCPPVHSIYARTLQPHVDRIVPWDQVHAATEKLSTAAGAVLEVSKGFVEELYFMCYTIATGSEHPAVVARLRIASEEARRKDSGFVGSIKDRVFSDSDDGQFNHMARRVSGSARQWVQAARGWLGSAVGNAKDGVASYKSRFEQSATVEVVPSQSPMDTVVVPEEEVPLVVESTPVHTSQSEVVVVEPSVEDMVEPSVEAVVEPPVVSVAVPDVEVAKEATVDIPLDTSIPKQDEEEDIVVEEPAVETLESVVLEEEPVVLDTRAPELPVVEIPEAETVVVETQIPETPVVIEETTVESEAAPAVAVVSHAEIPQEEVVVSVVTVISIIERPVTSSSEEHVEPATVAEETSDGSVSVIVAEDAASAVYAAREAMAGIILDKDDLSKFEALVKSATEVTENLEAFPSVVPDTDDRIPVAAPAEKAEKEDTIGPEDVVESPVVEKRPIQIDTPPAPASNEDDMISVTTTVPEPKEVHSDSETIPVVEEERQPIPEVIPVAKEEKEEEMPQQVTLEPQAQNSSVDEDVRKSAFNWVKDARKSISKELAEERTRVGPLVVDNPDEVPENVPESVPEVVIDDVTSLDNPPLPVVSVVEPEHEIPVPPAPKVEQFVPENQSQEPAKAANTKVLPPPADSKPVPAMVVQEEEPERVIEIPKAEDKAPPPPPLAEESSSATASKTEPAASANAAKSAASKSEMSDAAPAPAPGEQKREEDHPVAGGSDTANTDNQTSSLKRFKKPATVTAAAPTDEPKGPRKVKKTKKRVVKKTAAPESNTQV
ncbi:hypothetical protein EV175_000996 [Coemansia sp. RSA 1933]|nr:hypothetical protein EV175_000996 [Coemansia sp. RSA 1933]